MVGDAGRGAAEPREEWSDGEAAALLRFFHLAGRLKETARAGWALRGVAQAESVADHSFRLALLAYVLSPRVEPPLDRGRCVAMALVHDLAECLVGDLTPYDGVPAEEKRRREEAAVRELDALAGGAGLLELWAEYDAAASPEARFVKELDRLETALQAAEYAHAGAAAADDLREFREAAERRVAVPVARALLDALAREPGAA